MITLTRSEREYTENFLKQKVATMPELLRLVATEVPEVSVVALALANAWSVKKYGEATRVTRLMNEPHSRKMLVEYLEGVKGKICLLEHHIGQCGNCGSSLLGIGLLRWLGLTTVEATQAVKPVCRQMYNSQKPEPNVKAHVNKSAGSGMGMSGGEQTWE